MYYAAAEADIFKRRNDMNRRELLLGIVGGSLVLPTAPRLLAQPKAVQPDLTGLVNRKGWTLANRIVSAVDEGTRKGVRFSEAEGDGVAYYQGLEFANGTIEFDARGKDVYQKSFLGVAFHAVDARTYDAVYFRPFNFRADDPARHSHAVQYISHPEFTWQKLRAEQPLKYEQPVSPAPDPNGWFHVRVVVASPQVSVFVDNAAKPCLVVGQLSTRKKGLVGFFVGNGSGGDFASLRIV
jgi:hypothetical protein